LGSKAWSPEAADKLQGSVDRVFGTSGQSLLGLEFSFSLADPSLDGCPLIGCSTGFTKLCGYELEEIVGRNCRFLVEPVAQEDVDIRMRKRTKDFCQNVLQGIDYKVPPDEWEPWMPEDRPGDELIAVQRNMRKDGTLFNNMFLMKAVDLGAELGKERPYIVALQSELREGKEDLAKVGENINELEKRMQTVKAQLSSMFFVRSSLSRQAHTYNIMGTQQAKAFHASSDINMGTDLETPKYLHTAFNVSDVKKWEASRFRTIKKVSDAPRNKGTVQLMEEVRSKKQFAVKQMPNSWMRSCHEDFVRTYPKETELPWQDIGCTAFLNQARFAYAVPLEGVYRSDEHTFVVSGYATEGDLFTAAQEGHKPGVKREAEMAPLAIDTLTAVRHLHDLRIAHRDISLENVILTKSPDGKLTVKLIDFSMATTDRKFRNCPRGKASYQAPEMNGSEEVDAYLSDAFAAGVVLYGLFVKDYPWLSTKPGRCKCFGFVKERGFQAYCAERCVRGSDETVARCVSKDLMSLFDGMLTFNPKKRLPLGGKHWPKNTRSVWDEPWMVST